MSGILEAMGTRYSTRGYTEEKLTREEIDALVTAGLQAPTAANRQEIHFTVVDGKSPILSEIHAAMCGGRGITNTPHNFYYEAPTVIILSGDKSFYWSAVDAGIAVQNIALAAEALGLGSLIIGCIKDTMRGERGEYFNAALKVPAGYEFEVAIAVGHKDAVKPPHDYDAAKNVTIL